MRSYWLSLALAAVGCSSVSNSGGDDGPLGGSRTVMGSVVDFKTGTAISGAASVSTAGLLPPPQITANGADFTLEGIPDNSAFQILASSSDHRPTYGQSVIVVDHDLSDVKAVTLSESYLASLASGFGVSPTAANGIVLVHLVDGNGAAKAGVTGSNIVLKGTTSGPHFLDANLIADKNATQSSASGYAVFFEVAPGLTTLGQAVNATATLEMAASPVGAGAVTIADIKVTDGPPTGLPKNVSFATQVAPIFSRRGCIACHSGNGPGKALGGLQLDGGNQKIWNELVTETTYRVVLATPETSKVLTMPSAENPPDAHPNITFTGPQDKDYLTILVWIREGAKNN